MARFMAVIVLLLLIGCSGASNVDLSAERLYGYQPGETFPVERGVPIMGEEPLGQNRHVRYEDGVSMIVTPESRILSIEAPSELALTDSRDGIRRGDSIDKVKLKMGQSYKTRMEQGAKIYTYRDRKNEWFLEYWCVEEKVQIIRFTADE